jgi:hypothetical protein
VGLKKKTIVASYYVQSSLSTVQYITCCTVYSILCMKLNNIFLVECMPLPDIEHPPAADAVAAVDAVAATAVAAFAFDVAVAVARPLAGSLLLIGCCCCHCVSFLTRPLLC